ncbi:MAG: MauE/DoxX family redox-associated membrane protein [Acidimicrobiia bacterium]
MTAVGWVASVALGAVFLLSGGLKASNPGWPAQARALGAPKPIAVAVPWIELAVGALLVVRLVRPVVAIAAIVMLVAFTSLIGYRLARGQRPACSCFGNLSVRPIGVDTLIRNMALIALGVIAAIW